MSHYPEFPDRSGAQYCIPFPDAVQPLPDPYQPDPARLFELGEIVATPDAVAMLGDAGIRPSDLLWRHERGDWGNVRSEDAALNAQAAVSGRAVLSAYPLGAGRQLWIVTSADRAVTVLLLPHEG